MASARSAGVAEKGDKLGAGQRLRPRGGVAQADARVGRPQHGDREQADGQNGQIGARHVPGRAQHRAEQQRRNDAGQPVAGVHHAHHPRRVLSRVQVGDHRGGDGVHVGVGHAHQRVQPQIHGEGGQQRKRHHQNRHQRHRRGQKRLLAQAADDPQGGEHGRDAADVLRGIGVALLRGSQIVVGDHRREQRPVRGVDRGQKDRREAHRRRQYPNLPLRHESHLPFRAIILYSV